MAMTDRAAFWRYCKRAEMAAKARAKKFGVTYAINAHDIDKLLVDQKWACAVTKIELRPIPPSDLEWRLDPFGPSLDRIVPDLGYVRGNVRIVCNMANMAMNEWGLDNLLILLRAMQENQALLAYSITEGTARAVARNRKSTKKLPHQKSDGVSLC